MGIYTRAVSILIIKSLPATASTPPPRQSLLHIKMGKKVTSKQAKANKAKAEAAAKKTDAPMDDEDDACTQEEESDDGMPSTKKRHVPNEQLSDL